MQIKTTAYSGQVTVNYIFPYEYDIFVDNYACFVVDVVC